MTTDQHDLPAADAATTFAELQARAATLAPLTPDQVEASHRAREEASAALVREMRRIDAAKRWHACCPEALKVSDWDHPRLAPYRAQIDRVLGYQIGPKGILASGPTGRGKTRAMWALMRRLGAEEGLDVRYWSASDWFSELQDQIRYGRDCARGWVEAVAARRVVLLDDLGQESIQTNREEWAQGWLFRFLDLRVGARLPLFVTTNLTASEMAGRAGSVRGDPLVRRLLDLCEPVNFESDAEREARRHG